MKSKSEKGKKVRKVRKTNMKAVVLNQNKKKKGIKIDKMLSYVTFEYFFIYLFYTYVLMNIMRQLYNKVHLNNVLVSALFLK